MLAPQRGRRRRAFLAALKRLSVVNWVRIVWLVAVLWYELGAFFWSAAGCQWPNFDHLKLGNSKGNGGGGGLGSNSPAHVLLVADPQILDHRSYPGRSGWLMSLSQFIVDLNLRKSWLVASRFGPDVVIFLGDMMDNGRLTSSDEEYDAYVARFKSTFKLRNPETKVYYIPGNHDVGLRSSDQFHPRRRQRYLANFGPFNERISIANHTLALLDAPGLVEEDYKRASFGTDFENWKGSSDGAVEFIKEFRREGSEDPVILLTHIPLHRPDTASCGPLRERGTIRRGVGFGYQLTLGKLTAEFLLRNTRPSLVFSADDHDYCDYTHKVLLDDDSDAFTVREVTVKSFSMAMGIKRPGFQLLSLLPHESGTVVPQGVNTFADAPCLLPDQLTIYIERYLPLFVFTLIALAVSSFRKVSMHQFHHKDLHLPFANAPHDPRRESSWAAASLSPEELRSYPATPLTHPSNYLRLPNNASHRTAAGAPPATPTFHAFSPAANQLETPVLFNGTGLGITVGGAGVGGQYDEGRGGIEDEHEAYEMLSEQTKSFFPSKSGWTQHRERRWMWSWDFVFSNRRRRVSIGVPPTFEAFIRRLCGGQSTSANREPTLWGVFFYDLRAAAWPPLLTFILIVYCMFW